MVSNTDEVIDSRDVIARIEELQAQDDLLMHNDEREELAALLAFMDEANDAEDWEHGATFVHDDYFEDYARELAQDIGAVPDNASLGWPLYCIDWERAARELRMDYTSYEFDGQTYWARH